MSGSKKIMKRYGLRVSPWMVPRLMLIGGVVPKWLPVNEVVESLYILPMISIASVGYPRSSMSANSLAWSIVPNAFLKSIYVMYMSLFVSLASSRMLGSSGFVWRYFFVGESLPG